MRIDKNQSPLTDEELYPFNAICEEIGHLIEMGEATIDEFHLRYPALLMGYPWIMGETTLARRNNIITWSDSLGNHGSYKESEM